MFMKHSSLDSDIGWLLKDESTRNFVSVDEHKEIFDFR